jgi:hypothetical protein
VNETVLPKQIVADGGTTVTIGVGLTVTVILSFAGHPSAEVPMIVYVVVVPGLATTFEPVVALNPVPGLHV